LKPKWIVVLGLVLAFAGDGLTQQAGQSGGFGEHVGTVPE
jgi:hypothetical protein